MSLDGAEFILEELELGDARLAAYRPELLACVAAAIEDALKIGADEIEAGEVTLDLGDMPDLYACLEQIATASYGAGEERGKALADRLPDVEAITPRDVYEQKGAVSRALEKVREIAERWRDAIREAIVERYKPMLESLLEVAHVGHKVTEVAEMVRGLAVSLEPPPEAGSAAVEGVAAAAVIPEAAAGFEALEAWAKAEVQRSAEALRNTTAEHAVVGVDVEAHEEGKVAAVEADPRVRVIDFHAVLDQNTTCLCGALAKFTMSINDRRRTRYMPPLHINCRSTIGFSTIPESDVNFDTPRVVTVNEGRGKSRHRVTYTVAPADIHPSGLGGTAPPPEVLSEVM